MPDFSKLKPKKEGKLPSGRFDLSARDRDDGFGFVFNGDFHCPVDGEYVFATSSDDGSLLFVDGKKVVDNDGLHAEVTREGKVVLKAGKHSLEVRFFENKGFGGALKVSWKMPSGAEQVAAKANPMSELQTKATELAHRITQAEKKFTTTLVAKELPKPRVTKLLHRGEYDQPQGEPLQPGVPSALGILPKDAPANRLGLAQWLVSPEQPLVARVLVNRIWQRTFGHGIVRTPADFGLQGQQPTHPELLDWLAVELQEGWNLKKMLRLLVTSRAFKQKSSHRVDLPDLANLLFGRGPSYRLDAEVLRDVALWSSGLLDPTMGGEGVKPYQPPGMWKELMHPGSNTKNYVADKGDRLYRRSLYVYWKRTSPHPMMTLFDAPSRETACVLRSRTNTPLQSLALFNEPQRIESARKLAERLLREVDNDAARLDLLFTLIASRPPNDIERSACAKLLQAQLTRYSAMEDEAKALLAIGNAPRDVKLKPVEVAAWTQVAGTVLASDLAILLY